MAEMPDRFVMACSACRTSGGPYTAAEALHLARVHDDLHHGGAQTAEATDQHWCESCRLTIAVVEFPLPDGSPFRVCSACAPTAENVDDGLEEVSGRFLALVH